MRTIAKGKIPRVDRPIALRRARAVLDLAGSAGGAAQNAVYKDDAGIVIADGKVALLGSTADADRWVHEHSFEAPEVVDCAGRVLLPGLINAHTHLYSTLARGMPLLGPPPS